MAVTMGEDLRSDSAGPCTPPPNTACLSGQACGTSARREWPAMGGRGTILLEAAGAFVVALAARRSCFRYTSCSPCYCGSSGAVPSWLKCPRVFLDARLRS